MGKGKSAKRPEKKKPPDKTKKKKIPLDDDKNIVLKKEQQQRPGTVKRKGEGGVASPTKRPKIVQRYEACDDEDGIPSNDCSSDETEEDDEKLSSQDEKSPDTFKSNSSEAISNSSKRTKGNSKVIDEDEGVDKGSSESQEEKPEPKPPKQLLRGTRYIKINGNTWKIILARGDGNCLFYTLAYLLGRSPADHRQIRADIVHAAMNLFWEDIRDDMKRVYFSGPEFQGKTDEELNRLYFNQMGRDGVYASEIEMKVASMLYPFKICYVQQYVQPNPHDYRVCDVDPDSNKPIKWIRFSSGENYEKGHFEPLDPVGEIEPLSDGGYDDDLRKIDTKKESNHASTSSNGASELSRKPEYLRKTSQPNSNHKCSECEVNYEDAMTYYRHCLKKHPNQTEAKGNSEAGRCPICDKILARKRNVPVHILSVHMPSISKQFKCPTCDKSFTRKKNLVQHQKTHSQVAERPDAGRCPICDKIFANKRYVPNHIKIVHMPSIPKQFKCPTCEKCFNWKDTLTQHQKTHSQVVERPYACEECGKAFSRKSTLSEHLATHLKVVEKPYACEECGKSFKTKNYLKKHAISHVANRPFKCKQCGKAYKTASTLNKHVETHSQVIERPYACEECGKSFRKKYMLTGHLKTHWKVEERPYTCDECGKAFTRKNQLSEHLVKHTESRPFVCELCSKDFKSKSTLRKHYISHSDDRPFKCKICSMGFRFKQHLDGHEITHCDDKTFKCDKCEKSFARQRSLNQHLQFTHSDERPFKCSICFRSFKRKHALQEHQRLPCAPRYSCPHCKNVWFDHRGNLTRHLTIHQPKTFICGICGRACRDKYHLFLHQKVHVKNRRTSYPFPCVHCSLRCRTSDQRELHTYLHHLDAYTKEQQDIKSAGHQVVGPTAHKYVLYTVLLVNAEDFSGGTGDDVWTKLCDNPGKYDVKFYTGVYSSLCNVSVRPGHMQPAAMSASAVYQHHITGWRCFGATEIMQNYVQMRRREAIYIEWAMSRNSTKEVCINKKSEPLPKQEHRHIESLKKSGLNYFCFDKNHCSGSDRAHAIPNTDIPLGLHLHGRLHEMYFRGCGCDTCKYISKQPSIDDYFEVDSNNSSQQNPIDKDNQTQYQVSEDAEEDIENSVGVLYETALDPEAFEDEESEEDEDTGESETDEDEQEMEI